MELAVDKIRLENDYSFHTGVFVRAKFPNGKWDSVDVSLLTKESLLEWLRSRGGNNPYAENFVGILLNYGQLTEY